MSPRVNFLLSWSGWIGKFAEMVRGGGTEREGGGGDEEEMFVLLMQYHLHLCVYYQKKKMEKRWNWRWDKGLIVFHFLLELSSMSIKSANIQN